ncbi:FecR family protein [Pedobacter sp. L105]|uniref:FecR family protein n=1 Tax=Pedobacter sp. L105 TaxID=1641871 RepID=UPI00131BDBB1|nr:FecR family protein [Pedobacter sp. L105]
MEDVHKQYFLTILKKYRQGNATREEIKFLETYYDLFEVNEDLINEINEEVYITLKDQIKKSIDINIQSQSRQTRIKKLMPVWLKYSAAALVLIVFSLSGYFILHSSEKHNLSARNILPGGNKAVLTLSNGKKIILDNAARGQIATQSGINITKTASGQITYTLTADNNKNADRVNNTISTPKGGQYQVILPDGTRVWLNAASSLSYPASFHGDERMVKLNGEAYFEVTKNKKMPFKVQSGLQVIEVLGTHFNVNAYTDENDIKTTLLEGSVKVSSGNRTGLLIPGQQSLVNRKDPGNILTRMVNTEKETAWKNGVFSFAGDDLKSIMRQVSRWYDVNVIYTGPLTDEKYFGEISRKSNLSDVIKILELNNLHFEIDGKTIKISANQGYSQKHN